MSKGLLIVISGPSGSGKGTVNNELLKTGEYAFSISATTRAPRPGEQDGVNYYYISREDFLGRVHRGEMLEYAEYSGNYYGTPLSAAEAVLESGKNLILEIEVAGAMQVKSKHPEAILIMLLPPDYAELERRLRGRATEPEDVICARLDKARAEVPQLEQYDYVVYNETGKEAECAQEIRNIVRAEHHRTQRHPTAAEDFFA